MLCFGLMSRGCVYFCVSAWVRVCYYVCMCACLCACVSTCVDTVVDVAACGGNWYFARASKHEAICWLRHVMPQYSVYADRYTCKKCMSTMQIDPVQPHCLSWFHRLLRCCLVCITLAADWPRPALADPAAMRRALAGARVLRRPTVV